MSGCLDPSGELKCAFSLMRKSGVTARRLGATQAAAAAADAPKEKKALVTGTSADLRKLPLAEAKEMLRQFGVPEDQVHCLTL